jgi:hypothetical protein
MDMGLYHDCPEGSIDPPARLQERGEERARSGQGHVQLDVTGLGAEKARPAAVAGRQASLGPLVSVSPDRLGCL